MSALVLRVCHSGGAQTRRWVNSWGGVGVVVSWGMLTNLHDPIKLKENNIGG